MTDIDIVQASATPYREVRRPFLGAKPIAFVLLAALLALASSLAWAEGRVPQVAPVTIGQVQYEAPNAKGTRGVVVARDLRTDEVLWKKTIFYVFVNPLRNRDKQLIYIKRLHFDRGALIITDDRNGRYSLDLDTRKVTRVRERTKKK